MSLEDIRQQYYTEPSSRIVVYGEFIIRGSEEYDEDEPYIFFVDGVVNDDTFTGYWDNEDCPEYLLQEFLEDKEKYIFDNLEKLRVV